jgi:hypothetical protein
MGAHRRQMLSSNVECKPDESSKSFSKAGHLRNEYCQVKTGLPLSRENKFPDHSRLFQTNLQLEKKNHPHQLIQATET